MLSARSQEQKDKHRMPIGHVGAENLVSEVENDCHWRLGRRGRERRWLGTRPLMSKRTKFWCSPAQQGSYVHG